MVLATAQEVSFWQWMPSRRRCRSRTLGRRSRPIPRRQHAAVGVAEHRPLGAGVERGRHPRARTPGRSRKPSKKCSQSRKTRRPSRDEGTRRCRRPSPGSPPAWCAARARRGGRRTWRPGRPPGSPRRAAPGPGGRRRRATPALRVAPNATSTAWRSFSSVRARRKNSVSLGIAPGQPPSMKPTPNVVEQPGDGELVGDGVADPLALRTVAQSGVVDLEVVAEGGAGRAVRVDIGAPGGGTHVIGQHKRPLADARGLRVGSERLSRRASR